MPFAIIDGKPLTTIPTDLYIPPDALEVILEAFEGPLDLLLYLIRRQNLNILDIPIKDITDQYIKYINLMNTLNFELAAEYLVMAAMLAEIKSRMLLPKPPSENSEEADPRAELVRRLQEYERFKKAAEDLDTLPRIGRDTFRANVIHPHKKAPEKQPDISIKELIFAFRDVMTRADLKTAHAIEREPLSVRDRMSSIMKKLKNNKVIRFQNLFSPQEGKQGAVVTFLAILELLKSKFLEVSQNQPFSDIYITTQDANV